MFQMCKENIMFTSDLMVIENSSAVLVTSEMRKKNILYSKQSLLVCIYIDCPIL